MRFVIWVEHEVPTYTGKQRYYIDKGNSCARLAHLTYLFGYRVEYGELASQLAHVSMCQEILLGEPAKPDYGRS